MQTPKPMAMQLAAVAQRTQQVEVVGQVGSSLPLEAAEVVVAASPLEACCTTALQVVQSVRSLELPR